MPKGGEIYDQDFLLWTMEQAAALRRASDSNLPLDWENLAEEIESLGTSQRVELNSQIRPILRYLFKLEAFPAVDPHAGWRTTVCDARVEIEDLLETSPSLRREIEGGLKRQSATAARLAAHDLEDHGEPADAVWVRLEKGGFSVEQILGDWFPDTSS
jgi:hypothetical protein